MITLQALAEILGLVFVFLWCCSDLWEYADDRLRENDARYNQKVFIGYLIGCVLMLAFFAGLHLGHTDVQRHLIGQILELVIVLFCPIGILHYGVELICDDGFSRKERYYVLGLIGCAIITFTLVVLL